MMIPRPYQRQCVDGFYQYYNAGKAGHGLIVVPTAGGKSLIIGMLATEICQTWPGQRILILSHVRELIKQNHAKVMECWKHAPAGIYSAALGLRQAHQDIVIATIQSVYEKAEALGHRDLLFIDEAHLLQFGNMGMYGTLIDSLLKINPFMKICGFTATDYRVDGGRLTEGEGKLFDDVIIEISIQHLLDEGYITPPISKASLAQADMEGVKKTGGDFNIKQMGERFDQAKFINAAFDSDMEYLRDRRSPAFFCATVENARHVAEAAIARGIECEVLDGETHPEERERKLERYRTGRLRGLASVGVMTTGTDLPNMDAVILYRATTSPGLYQQIVGRGFRVLYTSEYTAAATREERVAAIRNGAKPNFLVLDHGGNIERHGPVANVEKPPQKEKGKRLPAVKSKARICEICRTAHPLDARICIVCGTVMVVERDSLSGLQIESSDADIMGTPFARGEAAAWFSVEDVKYSAHTKEGQPNTMKVTYYCGIMQFNEWLHFERIGNLRDKALKWWLERSPPPIFSPGNAKEALEHTEKLKKPLKIQVVKRNKFYEVIRYEFHTKREESVNQHAGISA